MWRGSGAWHLQRKLQAAFFRAHAALSPAEPKVQPPALWPPRGTASQQLSSVLWACPGACGPASTLWQKAKITAASADHPQQAWTRQTHWNTRGLRTTSGGWEWGTDINTWTWTPQHAVPEQKCTLRPRVTFRADSSTTFHDSEVSFTVVTLDPEHSLTSC